MPDAAPVRIAHSSESPAGLRDRLGPGRWLYLAADQARMEAWEAALGTDLRRVPLQPLLDDTAEALRDPYLAWLDELTRRHHSTPAWWFTLISERNTITDPFFTHVAYVAAARKVIEEGGPPALIVADSWGVISAVTALLSSRGLQAILPAAGVRVATRLRSFAGAAAHLGFFVGHWWALRKTVALLSRRRSHSRPLTVAPSALVMNFLLDGDAAGSEYRERFFPGLAEWFEAAGITVRWLPLMPGRRRTSAKYRLMRAEPRFLVPEDWLRASDYIGALATSLRVRRLPAAAPDLGGLPMTGLLAEERQRQARSNAPRIAYLFSRLPGRLAAAGFRPQQVITWAENQLFDRTFVMASRQAFPDAQLLGIQNAPFYPNLLNTFPTRLEVELGAAPDRMLCSGTVAARVMRERTGIDTEPWCALRYQYLHAMRPATHAVPAHNVLVALPIAVSASMELLRIVEPVRRRHPEINWFVKFHPNSNVRNQPAILAMASAYQVAEGPLADWLSRADAMLTAGSGTALEAVAAGLPVLLVGSQTQLTLDPLAWFEDVAPAPVYEPAAIEAWLDGIGAAGPAAAAGQVLDGWFGAVTPEKMAHLTASS